MQSIVLLMTIEPPVESFIRWNLVVLWLVFEKQGLDWKAGAISEPELQASS